MLLNLRGGYALFREPSIRQLQDVFDPATLGWSPSVVNYFQGTKYMPRFEIGGISVLGDTYAGTTEHGIWSFQPTWTKGSGAHNLRAGWDYRAYQEYGRPSIHAAGRYDFAAHTTYLHELGHYLGLDEDDLFDRGLD